MRIILGLMAFFICIQLSAQEEWPGLKYENYIYKDNIRTVKLYAKRGTGFGKTVKFFEYENELHEPYMQLKSFERLYLYFDDMDYDAKDYSYTIIHCDANWQASDLAEMDYISGSAENDIEQYDYSVHEEPGFTNYSLQFPNDDIGILLSGNYLLVVYEDGDKENLVLSRRFLVYENKFPIEVEMRRPFDTKKMGTSHELQFSLFTKGNSIRNPMKEIKSSIVQNGRWDNAKVGLAPKFIRQNRLDFDYVDKLVFDAGNEFRLLDLRTLDFMKNKISQGEGQAEVWLAQDLNRSEQVHLTTSDLNGKYVIVNNDDFQANISRGRRTTAADSLSSLVDLSNPRRSSFGNVRGDNNSSANQYQENLDATYANVHFSLRCPFELRDRNVYIFGELSDWKIRPEYEMLYNEADEVYEGEVLLKQGVHDYAYVVVPKTGGKPDFSEFEGNRFETVNRYTIVVYYRPFGQQYDSIVAIREFMNDGL